MKGKLRSLFERANKGKRFKWKNETGEEKEEEIIYNINEADIERHECKIREMARICPICRIFGTAKGNLPSRAIVRDLHLTENAKKDLEGIDTGLKYTEWKFENVIDRITAQATPRQIERVPAGSKFNFEIIYTIEIKEQVEEDLGTIKKCMELLRDDYLGGHGSRGYGKVDFARLTVTVKKIDYYLERNEEAKQELDNIEGAVKFIMHDENN